MPKTRIYHVTDGDTAHLVNAQSPVGARAHVAKRRYATKLATQHQIVSLMQQGVKVENALEEDASGAEQLPLVDDLKFGSAQGQGTLSDPPIDGSAAASGAAQSQ